MLKRFKTFKSKVSSKESNFFAVCDFKVKDFCQYYIIDLEMAPLVEQDAQRREKSWKVFKILNASLKIALRLSFCEVILSFSSSI